MEKRDALREAMLENEARSVRTSKLDVAEIPSPNGSPGLGMMIAIVAKKETKVLSHLLASLGKGLDGAEQAHKILSKQPIQPVTSSQELLDLLNHEPVYADIHYGGEILHKGLFVPSGMMPCQGSSPITAAGRHRKALLWWSIIATIPKPHWKLLF